jgi:hypothetical protein
MTSTSLRVPMSLTQSSIWAQNSEVDPYYNIASITGTGEGGAVTLSLDETPILHGPDGPYSTDNLFDPTGVISPEPSSLVLLATGLLATALVMRKRITDRIRKATRTQR